MKLRGLTKLVLAGTALAATAATLTTATYAWYVTNDKVTATGVNGSVAGDSITGSLFIAQNDETTQAPSNYTTDITLRGVDHGDNVTLANGDYWNASFNPQSIAKNDWYAQDKTIVDATAYNAKKANLYTNTGTEQSPTYTAVGEAAFAEGTKYYTKTASTGEWINQTGVKVDGDVLTFKMWLKASQAGTANVVLTLDNTTAAPIFQTALSGTGLPNTITQGTQFVGDAAHALRIRVTQQNGTDASAKEVATGIQSNNFEQNKAHLYTNTGTPESPTYTPVGDAAFDANATYYKSVVSDPVTYQLDGVAKDITGGAYDSTKTTAATRTTDKITFTDLSSGDANAYYYAILGKVPANTGDAGVSTDQNSGAASGLSSFKLGANVDTLLTFEVWLEGSDAQCFDSCRGQSFSFDFKYTYVAAA